MFFKPQSGMHMAFAGALMGFVVACGAPPSEPDSRPPPSQPSGPARCAAPEGVNNNPSTIAGAVDLINALLDKQEGDLSLPCFLEALERPLRLNGSTSRVSAQPAVGPENPRLFLLTQDMWLSVVPDGSGLPFLELGQLTAPDRSIKAEIEFPVHEPLTPASPFERLPFGVVTTCGLCHADERPVLGIPNAVESKALRPMPRTIVSIDDIRKQHSTCDEGATPDRCALYNAIFRHGEVTEELFPLDMPTIFR